MRVSCFARARRVSEFLAREKTFSFVVRDGNKRYARLMKAKEEEIAKDVGMSEAVRAARNALEGGVDYSNGAYFWDGADIKTNYSDHAKVGAGIHFTEPRHNIYKIKSTEGNYEASMIVIKIIKGKKVKEKKVLGTYPWTYESTAAAGGTIFWRLGAGRLKATKGKEHK